MVIICMTQRKGHITQEGEHPLLRYSEDWALAQKRLLSFVLFTPIDQTDSRANFWFELKDVS
jgi:hypothetical protein